MNFDELKKEWDEQIIDEKELNPQLDKMEEAHLPIDNIRRKMKKEFYVQLGSMILVFFLPKIFNFNEKETFVFIFFYGLAAAFTFYYFYKFFKFYKHSYNLTYNSTRNLTWFYYELKMNIELYKAFTYILIFITISALFVFTSIVNGNNFLSFFTFHPEDTKHSWALINFIIYILIALVITEVYPTIVYGRPLKQVKKVLDELDE